ncbi:MHYT domain-containing protein [Streptomyces sp. NPDC026672]|uniref:MHYT domain-containing protein n=1 Tax=unclassified Streptomyces TaxID=2593676 RepID=UPI0033F5EC88
MNGTITQFHYGMITPVLAYLMACLGAALGLRCTTRSLRRNRQARKAAWLALGAVCIGSGIWTMHFIAMIGFSIEGTTVGYHTPTTLLSLLVAVVVVAIGVFTVGYRGASPVTLATAGVITGVGVAAMHYLGIASMEIPGRMHFSAGTVALSVVIAVVAATAALWAAVSLHTLWSAVGASAVMGLAVTGMHYTGMSAMSVHLHQNAVAAEGSSLQLLTFLLPMIAGPVGVLLLAAVIVMFDPDMLIGDEASLSAAPAHHAAPVTADTAADRPWGASSPRP